MAFQVVLKFILLLKFLGQLCMLTKFTNKLVYSTKKKKEETQFDFFLLIPFFPFFCFAALARTPSTIWKVREKGASLPCFLLLNRNKRLVSHHLVC